MRSFVLIASIAAAAAMCPNACSGNGICGANAKCSCYQNWQSADCSQRTCPFTLAWADTADGTNQAHYYAECGNKGTCDRKSGECKCFDGYEGKGCRRSTCPEGCSGHGTCEYIEELAGDFEDRRNGPGARYKDLSCNSQADSGLFNAVGTSSACSTADLKTTNVVSRVANSDSYHGHQYQLWDAGKIQGCKCDVGYHGADCSARTVPRGDDPLTTVKAEMMVQAIKIDCTGTATDYNSGDEFFMRFYDQYGGTWVTNTINLVDVGTAAGDAVVAAKVQQELQSLPNGVLSDIAVSVPTATAGQKVCHRFHDGVQHISAYGQTTDGNFKNSKGATNFCEFEHATKLATSATSIDLHLTFGNKAGQTGVQYLVEVDTTAQGAGAYPVSAGVGQAHTVSVAEVNYNNNLGNLSELSDCSDRGMDNGEGECECFDGFRGLACEEQEALV